MLLCACVLACLLVCACALLFLCLRACLLCDLRARCHMMMHTHARTPLSRTCVVRASWRRVLVRRRECVGVWMCHHNGLSRGSIVCVCFCIVVSSAMCAMCNACGNRHAAFRSNNIVVCLSIYPPATHSPACITVMSCRHTPSHRHATLGPFASDVAHQRVVPKQSACVSEWASC